MSESSAEKDAGRVDALWIESGGVLTLATRHDGQIEARTSGGRVVLNPEAVARLSAWLAEHMPDAEKDGDQGTPMISLALSPWEVFRALEALEGSRGYVALGVAAKLREAAPYHLAALADAGETCPLPPGKHESPAQSED